jgi:hypothetical protein
MFAGAISAMVESLGDYYAGARAGDSTVQGNLAALSQVALCCTLHFLGPSMFSEYSSVITLCTQQTR